MRKQVKKSQQFWLTNGNLESIKRRPSNRLNLGVFKLVCPEYSPHFRAIWREEREGKKRRRRGEEDEEIKVRNF